MYPESKPDLYIDEEGVCSACRSYESRPTVDWQARQEEFRGTLDTAPGPYHCVVPVSGGKDSHAQILKIREFGLNPLAVNARTCHLSKLGRRNLDNVRNFADLVEVAPNSRVRARLNKICLEMVGDISWPEHVSIFTQPVQIAVNYKIPFIIWGENPQNEYGGPNAGSRILDRAWLEEFGGLLGLRVSDLPFDDHELSPYRYPEESETVTGLFMGHFFPWDGYENALVARENGFQWSDTPIQASGFRYENLDNYQTGIHDFFKFLKFGFGRATDICCNHIRRGRMTREEALSHILEWDGKYPGQNMDLSLRAILANIDMIPDRFLDVCEMYVNRDILEGPVTNLAVKAGYTNTAA